jgi:hypothetical protein
MQYPSRRHATCFLLAGAAGLFAPAPHTRGADGKPLAIKGYDPVAYFTMGTPTRGLPEIEYEWDEHRYLFAHREHRELFKADPVRYAPQFANFCALALAMGKIAEADPESWLISDDKLYLFGASTGPHRFQQSLAENVAKANQNRTLIQR